MPKSIVRILESELARRGLTLLDIYSFKTHDLVRLKAGGEVLIIKSNRKINTLTGKEDVVKFVEEILGSLSKKK
ncbi:hypothetical protein ACSU1N_05350 [Thermogladius sp. 4427co]|uniref:hypothetical protein n=1 Tax=Thermogladius sp. 4427co TaxID=3450718 RepID=UPI003F78CC2B